MSRLVSGLAKEMRSRNVLLPAWAINISALTTCVFVLLYLGSQTKVMQHRRGTDEFSDDQQVVDVKYIEFFSIRPLQLVYLDKKGYRLALDSTDESSFIEARNGAIGSFSEEKTQDTSSNTNSVGASMSRPSNDGSMNVYEENDLKGDAERDESIDYNMGWEQFPEEPKRIPCSSKRPMQNVVFLRTHRSGSRTIANIMYRYGDLNDLEFALPKQKSYDFYWPLLFNPSFVDKKYLDVTPPNLLINARYSPDTMTSFMSKDSFFVAIIRKPSSHFESVFNGYQIDTVLGMHNFTDPLDEFLNKPRQYLLQYLKEKPRFDMNLNMVKNGQTFDLGLQHKYYNDPLMIERHINDLAEKIDLVLIMEYFDESLVLLKRELCWDLDDVVYFKLNQRSQEYKQLELTPQQEMKINGWNSADAALYDFFNNSLWDKIEKQDQTFYQEVAELRRKAKNLEEDCIHSYETNLDTGEIEIKFLANMANVNKYLCEKMIMTEESYVQYLKKKVNMKIDEHNEYQNQLFSNTSTSREVNTTRIVDQTLNL
ncbi:galactose-3-O-sulfotransferase 2-like isoform X1 [Montipora capricornis]|uniref:galactose-3-O-sulfotransferase 2-like isoform X1 n=1 Tax=Montipora capricornis TaxID=246305 RepID=UPI0035F21C4F